MRSATRLRARAAYLAYRAGEGIARALPAALAGTAARGASRALLPAMGERRRTVARHLRRVRGSELVGRALDRAVADVFASYARYWLEVFRLPGETPESIDAKMRMEGMEHLREAAAQERGVVLALPHLGGWDFGGAWIARQGFQPVAVAEVLEPPELFEWFVGWRRRLGVEIVPAGPEAGTALIDALQEGRVVGLVSDRDIVGSGVAVEFFGERTRLPGGPATVALRTGAPLLAGAVYFEADGGHVGVIRPPLDTSRRGRFREDVGRITQDLALELEVLIRRAPEQWHLLQPNWPSDPGWDGEPLGPAEGSGGRGAGAP